MGTIFGSRFMRSLNGNSDSPKNPKKLLVLIHREIQTLFCSPTSLISFEIDRLLFAEKLQISKEMILFLVLEYCNFNYAKQMPDDFTLFL